MGVAHEGRDAEAGPPDDIGHRGVVDEQVGLGETGKLLVVDVGTDQERLGADPQRRERRLDETRMRPAEQAHGAPAADPARVEGPGKLSHVLVQFGQRERAVAVLRPGARPARSRAAQVAYVTRMRAICGPYWTDARTSSGCAVGHGSFEPPSRTIGGVVGDERRVTVEHHVPTRIGSSPRELRLAYSDRGQWELAGEAYRWETRFGGVRWS